MILWTPDATDRNRPMPWVAIKKRAKSLWIGTRKLVRNLGEINWLLLLGIPLTWLAILLVARLLFGGRS